METARRKWQAAAGCTKRIAVIGDVHGIIDEFDTLTRMLQHESLDSIWHVGDLVDRGPDSGAVVRKCREENILGVLGNHESVIAEMYEKVRAKTKVTSADKLNTCSQLERSDYRYIADLPLMHIFDDLNVVLVHAGVEPRLPPWKGVLPRHHFFGSQTHSVCHVQLVHPDHPGKTRWWCFDQKNDCSEEENRRQGWVRWYELYDEPHLVVYGHSVSKDPFAFGDTLGIDTGGVFGGYLTAVILPDMRFVQVKAKRAYVMGKNPKNPCMPDL